MLKKNIKYIGILVILIILFRGFLYQMSVNYVQVKARDNVTLTDKNLIEEIDSKLENNVLSIDEIIDLSNEITSEKLHFTFNKVSSNPNLVCKYGKANCIGYSSLFNSIGNYIIKKQNLSEKYEFKHLVGKVKFFRMDIHKPFNSPFFKDHDFNEIRNRQTNEKQYVDPTLRDYLRIDYVTSE